MFLRWLKLSLVVISVLVVNSSHGSNRLSHIDDFFNGQTFPLRPTFEKQLSTDYGLGNKIDAKQLSSEFSQFDRNFGRKKVITSYDLPFGGTKGIRLDPSQQQHQQQQQQCYCPCANSPRFDDNIKMLSPILSPAQHLRAVLSRPQSANKMYHRTHDPDLVPQANLVHPTFCDFTKTSCSWMNDVHISSRFKYGYEEYFKTKLWFIDTSEDIDGGSSYLEQKHIHNIDSFDPERRSMSGLDNVNIAGWGRLVSPYYHNVANVSDACVMIHFEFISEGRDSLMIIIQDGLNSRSILDYKHDRANNLEESVLKKYVPFKVFGDARFFVQFNFRTTYNDNHYGFKYFHITFGGCSALSAEESNKDNYGTKY